MLLGELAKKAHCNKKTLDRYVQQGLIPYQENQSEYREFGPEAVDRVVLIRTLTKRPFRRNLREIKRIFQRATIAVLMEHKRVSNQSLSRFLSDSGLL